MQMYKVQNLDRLRPRTLVLLGGNAVHLMPRGHEDINGPTDCATITEDEFKCDDVQNSLRTYPPQIEAVKLDAAPQGKKASGDAQQPVQQPAMTNDKK